MYTKIKTLQREFVTDPDGWLGQSDKQEDGSYFIETDAHIFEHILHFLRTGVLPVFYDREKGHNFALYQSLLEEAKYFAIDRLEKWIRERKYLEAVKIDYLATETQDRFAYSKHTRSDDMGRTFMVENQYVQMTTSGNMETTMIPIVRQQTSFYCPRGNPGHGKSGEQYFKSCITQARDDKVDVNGGWREEDQLIWCIVRKEVVFDYDLCVNAYLEDALPRIADS